MGARNLKEKNMASVADPGIPEVASAQREVHQSNIWQAKNCMKIKEIGPRGCAVLSGHIHTCNGCSDYNAGNSWYNSPHNLNS